MKKLFLPFLLLVLLQAWGQPKMQGTLKPGSRAGTVEIYLKPTASFTQKDEAMSFALAIPAAVQPAPSIGSSGTMENSSGVVKGITGLCPEFIVNNLGCTLREVVTTQETINAMPHYIYTFLFAGTAQTPRNWTAGQEQLVFSLSFAGCTSGCGTQFIKMVSLPGGGSTKSTYWYFQPNTIGDITDYEAPFYENPQAAVLANGGSTDGSALSVIQLAVPLPVRLEHFTTAMTNCTVNLNWQVAEESGLSHYAVERSVNGQEFSEIGRLSPSTNAAGRLYSYADKTSPEGKLYYRLRIVNKNGSYTYGPVKEVLNNCRHRNEVMVYPNPAKSVLNIILPENMELAKIKLLNAEGKTVYTGDGGGRERVIYVNALPAGVYTLQVTKEGNIVKTLKVVLDL